jgi:hypothetical protein
VVSYLFSKENLNKRHAPQKLSITRPFNIGAIFKKQGTAKNFGLDAIFQKSFNIQKR